MINDVVLGVDLKVFIDIKNKYNQSTIQEVVNRYVLIMDKLQREHPSQERLWYQEEALRRTDVYMKTYSEQHKVKK